MIRVACDGVVRAMTSALAALTIMTLGGCGGSAPRNDFTERVSGTSSVGSAIIASGDWVLETSNSGSASQSNEFACLRVRIGNVATSCSSTQYANGSSSMAQLSGPNGRRFVLVVVGTDRPITIRKFSSTGPVDEMRVATVTDGVEAGFAELAADEELWGLQVVADDGSTISAIPARP